MKKPLLVKLMVVFGALGVWSCSPNQLAQTGEYDDLYFTSADRKAVVTQSGAVATQQPSRSAVSESDFKKNGEINYQQENYSSKTVNPEYISRYNAQNDETPEYTENSSQEEVSDEYFVEDYNSNTEVNRNTARNVGYNNYYGRGMGMMGMGMYDPFMFSGMGMMYDPFMYGGMYGMYGMYDPFWGPGMFMRPGLSISIGMGFGWNRWNRWGMGFYDPFWGPSFYNPWSPWGMGYWGGYNRGFYNGIAYTNIHNYYYDGNSPVRNTRTVVNGPRSSRNALVGANTTPMRNRATTTTTGTTGRRSELASATTTQRQASTLQNNYYNRSRSYITEQPVGRSAAEVSNRSIDRTAVTRAETVRRDADYYNYNRNTARPGTEFNRSTSPTRSDQYRTAPSRNNTQYRTNSPARSNTDYYRSAPSRNNSPSYNAPSRNSSPSYNAPSRSSTPTYRSAPSSSPSRSSGSYGGGSSAPSRGSSGGGVPSRR